MVAAIAAARAHRLKREALRAKAAIIAVTITAAAMGGIAWSAHGPQTDAVAAETTDALSIEDAIMEAIDPYDDFPEIDWEYWHEVNPAIVGWMTIEDTAIDHPIVQAPEESPALYLFHGIDGNIDAKGCIFLDAECDKGLDTMHSVIYGHNWSGGLMFADLARYANGEFAASHPRILLQTPDWKERLEVQCVEIANGTDDSNVIGFADEGEMALWYQERFRASAFRMSKDAIEPEGIKRIYTFCTCADGAGDKRVLVYAMPAMKARAASREAASTA